MTDDTQLIVDARRFYAGRFEGVLSTHSLELPGYPLGSLVPYSLDRQGRPLILISHLAQHTRNLAADPRCALTLVEPGEGDAQQRMRLSLVAEVRQIGDGVAEQAERHFRYFPAARPYFESLNFSFYRLEPVRAHLVGGFGAARWLGADRLLTVNPFDAATERGIVEHMSLDHRDALARYLLALGVAAPPQPPVLAGIDSCGVDIRAGDRLVRVPLPRRISTAADARAVLVAMARPN